MNLHRKTERKDLLTEHLYTIIRENELRKAKKLEELMAKLDVSPEGTTFVQQSSSLEVRSDESATKQTNVDTSVSQAGKTANSEDLKSNSESINPQNHAVEGSTASKETNVFVTQTDSTTTESLAENVSTVTSWCESSFTLLDIQTFLRFYNFYFREAFDTQKIIGNFGGSCLNFTRMFSLSYFWHAYYYLPRNVFKVTNRNCESIAKGGNPAQKSKEPYFVRKNIIHLMYGPEGNS